MKERWLPVVGFEGLYEVSDQGRVRSLRKGHVMRPNRHVAGYQLHHLYQDGVRSVFSAHALVAAAFIGPRPEGQEVCHHDGAKANNRLSNLRYDTPSANAADKHRHGTATIGERCPKAKLTADDVREIRAQRGVPQQDLADVYGCTSSNISAIQLRKSWRHV